MANWTRATPIHAYELPSARVVHAAYATARKTLCGHVDVAGAERVEKKVTCHVCALLAVRIAEQQATKG